MNVAMQLRKCCNHPYLLDGVEDEMLVSTARAESERRKARNEAAKAAAAAEGGSTSPQLLPEELSSADLQAIANQ